MSAGTVTSRRTAKCACQSDAHFGDLSVRKTPRQTPRQRVGPLTHLLCHAYGSRFPVARLHIVGHWPRTGTPILKCGPCRDYHTVAELVR